MAGVEAWVYAATAPLEMRVKREICWTCRIHQPSREYTLAPGGAGPVEIIRSGLAIVCSWVRILHCVARDGVAHQHGRMAELRVADAAQARRASDVARGNRSRGGLFRRCPSMPR